MLTSTHIFTARVSYPRDEVWNWFARPGALHRLAPPWMTLQPAKEAENLRDGEAVLVPRVVTATVPGTRWVATHQGDGFREGEQFVDVCTSEPYATATAWRHEHGFADHPDGTELTDRLTSRLPKRMLRPVFDYRADQLRADLAAHARFPKQSLTIAITGASGLVGTALTAFLSTGGHRVIRLVRSEPSTGGSYEERQWNPEQPDPAIFEGVDAVVHLAGASIAGRFTPSHMAAIRDSRVEPTRLLAKAAATQGDPKVFVSASAIGFYGADHGDELLDEASPVGEGFLASVVREWEAATAPAADAGLRTVIVRTGIVQSTRGGVLALLKPVYESFLGGRLGNGQQWTSWIALDDLIEIYHRALLDPALSGAVNAVAPDAVRNEDYSRELAAAVHRPSLLPVPAFGPRLLLGDRGARELAFASQRVVPAALVEAGHHFRFTDLRAALDHEVGNAATR
ncbi:TIGR01777 family oxidoreductase [Calidifontibacter terrae]